MNRQRLILFVLVIVFGVTALWSYSKVPRLKTVQPGSGAKQATPVRQPVTAKGVKAPVETDDGSRLKIGRLEEAPTAFKGYHRNLFKPLFVDEIKVVKSKAVAVKQLPPVKAAVTQPVEQQVIMQPETAPLARFTFLGFMKKGAVKTIFLAKEKDILLVKQGDKIAGRYEATEITDQALTLTVTDTGDEIVIPLIENRPLAAAK